MDHILELFLSFLKIIIPLSIITASSIILIKLLKVLDLIEKFIYIFLFIWCQIILSIEFLSLFKLVKYLPLIIFYIVIFITVLIIGLLRKIDFKIHFLQIFKRFSVFYRSLEINKIIKILIIFWLLVIIGTTFFIGINIPPNNWDSMVYHLARAGFWKQNQTINHYYTRYELQNEQPINAELGLLWVLIFTNSDNLAFMIQWLSLIAIIIILYKLLRTLNYNRIISFFSAFIFTSLDIVILESNTTQNDLVATCFIILSLFLIIRSLTDNKFSFLPLICAGMAVGIAIGTKGFAYFFIPAFLFFIFLFNRKDKSKWLKTFYIIIFSLMGVILFAGYNLVQNYLSYGNIILSQGSSDMYSIVNPNIKTFISNLTRHAASFYQFGDLGFLKIGTGIQHLLEIIHKKLSLDISSPATTWQNVKFSLSYFPLSYDSSYFGPIGFFIIMPSIFYNFILFIKLRYSRKNNFYEIKYKYINSLLFFSIPAIFFLIYCYIFKWEPWAGRLLIAMVLIMMINFAELLELLKEINHKVLVIIITILLISSIGVSFFSLFQKNNAILISSSNKKSIFSISNYDDRRMSGQLLELSNMVNQNLKEESNLGIILFDQDWIYTYFGKHFERNLRYISNEEYLKSSYNQLFKNLDGLLVNSVFITPRLDLTVGDLLLKIDYSNFNNYFQALNDCQFIPTKDNFILVKATGPDPYFGTKFPFKFNDINTMVIHISMQSTIPGTFKIYIKEKGKNYSEKNTKRWQINSLQNEIYITLDNVKNIERLRIDPMSSKNDTRISKIEFFKPNNIKFKNIDNYYLFYK